MSEKNERDGFNSYKINAENRAWFERQWRIWPERADERYTTNLSFHYGGVRAFRELHGRDPELSRDFAANVGWHDRHRENHHHSEAEV